MAKKKKKSERKRSLKYGNVLSERPKKAKAESQNIESGQKESPAESSQDKEFKKELLRNVIFVGGFLFILLILYFTLTRTSLLEPMLQIFRLGDVYK